MDCPTEFYGRNFNELPLSLQALIWHRRSGLARPQLIEANSRTGCDADVSSAGTSNLTFINIFQETFRGSK